MITIVEEQCTSVEVALLLKEFIGILEHDRVGIGEHDFGKVGGEEGERLDSETLTFKLDEIRIEET